MHDTTTAASEAARALINSRWQKVTDPDERKAATAAATKARRENAQARREAAYRLTVQRIADEAGPLTASQRDKIAAILAGGQK